METSKKPTRYSSWFAGIAILFFLFVQPSEDASTFSFCAYFLGGVWCALIYRWMRQGERNEEYK